MFYACTLFVMHLECRKKAVKVNKMQQEEKKPLTKAIADIARSMDNINTAMSDFNAPGLKHAFTDALRIALKRQGKFDERAAFKRLEDYYKDR